MVVRRRRSAAPAKKRKPKTTVEQEQEAIIARFNELFLEISDGKSRNELAEILGVSPSRVSQLKSPADSNPQLRSLADMGYALGVRFTLSIEEL